jgi:hypothetical protein
VEEASHAWVNGFAVVDSARRGMLLAYDCRTCGLIEEAHSVVLMLSNGVTASNDSVIPAPNPAMTVLGPDIWPASSCSRVL